MKNKRCKHTFVVTKGLMEGKKITGLDFDCTKCSMRLFVQGSFSWHRGGAQMPLTIKEI